MIVIPGKPIEATVVRTRSQTCECPDPHGAHEAFIYTRGDGVRHHVQDIVRAGRSSTKGMSKDKRP